jgi:DNA gyrase/topoisomerase IV subunit B
VQLTVDAQDDADQIMDMMLAKKRASDRRDWLETKGNLATTVAPPPAVPEPGPESES